MKDLFGNDTKLPVERVPGQRKAEVVHKQMITIYGKTEGQKCKGCASFYFRLFSKKYPKCKLSGCTEGNRNSDWNSRWDACGRFEPKETK